MINVSLFRIINSWAGQYAWLDLIMIFVAQWLGYLLILGVIIYFFKNRNQYKEMLIVSLISALIARFVFTEIIRFLYNIPRPFMVLDNVNKLIALEAGPSFPSGHATFYFALATGVYLCYKKVCSSPRLGYVYFALAGLIGFSRIYVGVHWPADMVAGAILGLLTALGVNYLASLKKN